VNSWCTTPSRAPRAPSLSRNLRWLSGPLPWLAAVTGSAGSQPAGVASYARFWRHGVATIRTTSCLAGDRIIPFAHASLRWLFVGATTLHFAKGALTLHLFLQDADCGVDVFVADINLHWIATLFEMRPWRGAPGGPQRHARGSRT